ncbi:unnamed protein product [Blepharisma stoltei]|uniref:Uncharacterized protein n=1 Tax=Blepharisma stoltei TaxID=1481888 RepID=A0AAU9JMD4_9CILI|nr:unnamed protein product [Blepharisma stoltei]
MFPLMKTRNCIKITPVNQPDSFTLFKSKFCTEKAIEAVKKISDRTLKLPKITNPKIRLSTKEPSSPSSISPTYRTFSKEKQSYPLKGSKSATMLIEIDNIIQECNTYNSKGSGKFLHEISRSEGEMLGVIKELEKYDRKDKRSPRGKPRQNMDNEVYINRSQIKKMIVDLRRQTKRIGAETYYETTC